MMGDPRLDEPRKYSQTEVAVIVCFAQHRETEMARLYANKMWGVPAGVFERVVDRLASEGLLIPYMGGYSLAGMSTEEHRYWTGK